MAGLACARELRNRNYEVLVVEARGRAGGRLKGGALEVPPAAANSSSSSRSMSNGKYKQQQHPDASNKADTSTHLVDLGGALIHGINDNPVYSLVSEMGANVKGVEGCLLMDDSGWPVDPKQDAAVQTVFNECLEESFSRTATTTNNGGGSVVNINAPRSTRSKTTRGTTTTASSFGDLFDRVRREKSVTSTALLRWHQANLEVSCGAGMDRLGWQWNEDEPYGFDGDHVALQASWKPVVDSLADHLEIWYHAPVTRIQIIHPPVAVGPDADTSGEENCTRLPVKRTKTNDSSSSVPTSPARKTATSPTLLFPSRKSRRIRGEDAAVRRSDRSNKGAVVERFTVQDFSSETSSSLANNSAKKRPRVPLPQATIVQVTVQQPGKEAVVLQADALVCTLPLGILKLSANENGGVIFDPPLPATKLQAIERLGTGLLNKCALSFSHMFWQDSDFLGLAEEEHSYLVLNAAAYTGQPILIFMYGGNFAKEIEEWTDEGIVEDCLDVLKKICGRELPAPLDYHVTRWGYEQYSRMSFTYIPPGVDGFAELRTMNQPIYDSKGQVPVLMFAGEHTSPYHPSTIHGAFLSGIREAYR
jgi:hypothetical protein